MMNQKAPAGVFAAVEMEEGAGARVRRAFPTGSVRTIVDPFVVLDEFLVDGSGGFPEHPHRGQETVTYMIEGAFRHTDNLGNESTVEAGGLQRTTAGRGIVHSEMPDAEGLTHGLQLWISLPRAEKGISPGYQEVVPEEVPAREEDGATVRSLIGDGSPISLRTPVEFLDVEMVPGAGFARRVPEGWRGVAYLLSGSGHIGEEEASAEQHQFVVLEDPGRLAVSSGAEGLRFALIVGKPHGELVRLNGPFVD